MGERNRSALVRSHSGNFLNRLLFESEHAYGGGQENRSLLFRLFQTLVIVIRLITPLSYIYVISLYLFRIGPQNFVFGKYMYRVLLFWTLSEVVFFPYYCYLFQSMNRHNKDLTHFSSNKQTRNRLAKNCFEALESSAKNSTETTDQYCRRVIEGWFLDQPIADIHRDDVAKWTAWAFFGLNVSDLTAEEVQENESYVDFLATKCKWTFPPGTSTKGAVAVRLNLDPVFATQRPAIYYAAIAAVNSLVHVGLKGLGFKHLPEFDTPTKSQAIYYRAKEIDPDTTIADRAAKALPIVFVHGIGIGYAHYFGVVSSLPTDVDVYLVEWPNVSMQMNSCGPTPHETITAITKLFAAHGHKTGCFVTHSLGTVMMSWLLKDVHACKLVGSSVIMDPVSFLLCDPTVATNFVYREPTTPLEFMMHFFVSRELFIANALSRHFAWSHNIMFVEDFLNAKSCTCHNSIHDVTNEEQDDGAGQSEGGDDTVISPVGSPAGAALSSSSGSWDALSSEDDTLPLGAARTKSSVSQGQDRHHHSMHKTIEHTIILSSEDRIVPVKEVARYLEQKQRDGFNSFEVLMTPCVHGEVMLKGAWIKIVVQKIKDRCGLNNNAEE